MLGGEHHLRRERGRVLVPRANLSGRVRVPVEYGEPRALVRGEGLRDCGLLDEDRAVVAAARVYDERRALLLKEVELLSVEESRGALLGRRARARGDGRRVGRVRKLKQLLLGATGRVGLEVGL